MARILSRPMFRKGGLSKAPRPSYRGGGVTAIRPRYKQGGRMTGIMSGIVPRKGYADGYNWWETPLGQTIKGTGTEARKIGAAVSDLAGVPINALTRFLTGYNPGFSGAKAFGLGEEEGVDPEKAYFFGVPTSAKTGWEIKSKEPKKVTGVVSPPGGGDSNMYAPIKKEDNLTGDMETDFMSTYKEYLPVMEEALAGRPSTKSKWLALAKFGTGLMAQPGGDLIGAIGKASQMPLDDLAKLEEKMQDKKTQAKLLAVQAAMKDAEPGTIGKNVKDIKKLLGLKGKEGDKAAFAIYDEMQRNNTTQIAADTKAYRAQAESLGVSQEGYVAEMAKIKNKYPELAGQFTTTLPTDEEDREIGGYYVAPTGAFVRVIEKDGKKVTIGMDEPGFKDKPKKK